MEPSDARDALPLSRNRDRVTASITAAFPEDQSSPASGTRSRATLQGVGPLSGGAQPSPATGTRSHAQFLGLNPNSRIPHHRLINPLARVAHFNASRAALSNSNSSGGRTVPILPAAPAPTGPAPRRARRAPEPEPASEPASSAPTIPNSPGMAENVPPTTAGATPSGATAANANDASTRGVPYYEQLKRTLRETLHKKRLIDKNMEAIEQKLARAEQQYLEDTPYGNIIKGFDNYIKGTGITTTGPKRKAQVLDSDRLFSRSSASFVRDSPGPSSAQTTPSHAPTPTSSFAAPPSTQNSAPASQKGATTKKHKKGTNKDDEDTEEGKPAKRYKVSYVRE